MHGCTLADQVNQIATDVATNGQFVRGVAQVTQDYWRQHLLPRAERQVFLQAVQVANIPPRTPSKPPKGGQH